MDNIVKQTNSILENNRRILKLLLDEGRSCIGKSDLILAGFCFVHLTHTLKHQSIDVTYAFSYDYGIGRLNGDSFEIIKLQM